MLYFVQQFSIDSRLTLSSIFYIGSCSSNQFACLDGTCVLANERCNKVATCPDQSDERNCGM